MEGTIKIKCECGSETVSIIKYKDEETGEILVSHAVCHGCMKNICMEN